MARYRKDEEKKPTRNLVSDKALNALTSGTYDQITGRDPKYRSSNDQVKSTAGLPVLKGMLGGNNDTWESSFSRRNNTPLEIDTGRARQRYAEEINWKPQKTLDREDADMLYDAFNRNAASIKTHGTAPIAHQLKNDMWNGSKVKEWEKKYGKSVEQIVDEYAKDYDKIEERKNRQFGKDHPILATLKNTVNETLLEPGMALESWALGTFAPDNEVTKGVREATEYNSKQKKQTKSGVTHNMGSTGKSVYDFGTNVGTRMLRDATGMGVLLNAADTYEKTRQDLKNQGIEGKRAETYATTRGVMDAIATKIAGGMGGKAASTGGSVLGKAGKSFAKQFGLGTAEQSISELADALILGDDATYQRDVKNYMSHGMSKEEATKRAKENAVFRVGSMGLTRGTIGAASSLIGDAARGVQKGFRDLMYRAYMNRYVVDPDDPIFDEPIIDLDDLNEYFTDEANYLGQNNVPLLTGTADNTQALSGTTYNQVPALVDNIYPIQMSGTNGVIPMTGTQGTITLPDLASKSASVGKTIQRAVAERVVRPRTTTPIAGAEKEQAEIRLKFIDKSIKTNKQQIEQYNKLAKTGKNKAERKLYSDKAKALEVQNQELKTEKTDLNRQMKGELTPIKELLPDNVMKEVSSLKNEIKKVSNMYVGAENKALAKDAITALDNYIETGDMRYYNDFYNNVTALEKAATETYVNKTDPTKTSTYGTYHSADDGTSLGELVSLVQKNGQPGMYAKNLIPAVRNLVKEQNAKALPTMQPEAVSTSAPVENVAPVVNETTAPVLVNQESVFDPKKPYSIGVVHGKNGRPRYFIQERTSDNGTRPIEPGKLFENENDARQALLRVSKSVNKASANLPVSTAGRGTTYPDGRTFIDPTDIGDKDSLQRNIDDQKIVRMANAVDEDSSSLPLTSDNGHDTASSDSLSTNNVDQTSGNVNNEAEGYWLRVLGDDDFAVSEAEKQGVSVDTLRKAAADNTGYEVPKPVNNNVPPSNDVPPINEPGGNGPERERGMSKHMRGEGKMSVDIPEEVKDDFINDPDMYKALSNKETSDKALRIYNEHPDDREAIFRNMLTQYDPAALPLGQMIAKDYSAAGNHAMAAQIFRDMGERLTKAGQFSQASIITMLKNDPLTAQQYAERSIDKLNKQGKKEFGKKWENMALTKEEIDAFNEIEPGDEKALAELYDKIGQRLGREYPTTMMEKLLEGRKIAMLFNVRTISRNFFANPPTLGMRWMADRVESVGQNIVHLIDPSFEKTQSLRSGGTGRKLAKDFTKTERYQKLVNGVDEKHMVPDLKSEIIHHKQMYKGTAVEKFIDTWVGNAFNSMSDALYEAGKIKSNPHIKGGIQELNKRAFNKEDVQSVLESIRNSTYKLLDVTDAPFVKENFVERLGSYLNAQGIKRLEDIPEDAIEVAWNEALKATYKDDSWMVRALSGIKGGIEKIPGIGKPLSQGLIPFLQAPGNIAARMVDYSPINLTKGVAQIIKGATKKDHDTIRKGIEAAAKGLTGSGLALLGMKLYQSGILTGDYSQDNKEKSFQQRNGFKPWSLHVDGKYFTFNWMQPFAQTIMAGILAQQAIDNADDFDSDVLRHFGLEGSAAGKVIGAAYKSGKSAVNSWFDESPLGDLTKLFSGSYYDRDIAQNTVDVGKDFASAMYPATGNALAKTIDTTKRNTKDPSNAFSTFLNEQMAKVPGLSEKLPASYDTWGEEIKNANSRGEAFFQRFVFPGEYSSDSSDPLDVEIQRLFESTSDNRAFPFYAANKVGDKTLNNKEKSEYQKDMGQRSKQLAQAFVNSKQYKEMDDANRVETLNTLYYTSKAITERDLFDKPVADSSQYKKFIQAYDSAGGGKKGIEAVINMTQAKSSMKAANVSSSSNLGKKIEAAAKSGDDKAVQEMTSAAQSVEDLGFTKVGPKETYIKAKGIEPSLSVEDFGKTYKAIDTNGNQGITQKEVITYLNNNKVPELKGTQIFNMYAPAGKSTPAVKDDGTWYLQKPKKKK